MAASVSGGMCRLCWGPVPLKYRRLIFSSSFKVLKQLTEVLNYSPSQNDGHSHYLCYVCFNKLNKLEKIDFDVENKLNALAVEKASILQELRNKNTVNKLSSRAIETSVSTKASVGISSRVVTCPVTPTKCINRTKRTILHTPTPRKSKVHILGTPRKTVLQMETSASSRKRPQQLLFSPMKAKISYRGQNDRKVRTKIIREKGLYSVMVGIVRGNKPEVILNKLVKVKNFKEKAVKVLSKCVKEECKLLCGKNDPSILRGNTSEDIISIDFLKIANELKEKAPAFSQILWGAEWTENTWLAKMPSPQLYVPAWKRNILRMLIVLSSTGLAIIFRNSFALVAAFTGAIGSSLLAYILPCLFHLKLCHRDLPWLICFKDTVIIILGILCSIVSLYSVIIQLAKNTSV